MKFKKLVSAVSALTVAAGCIAGMTITASAADITADDVVFGVYNAETKTVSPQTEFTVDAGEGTTYTYIDTTYMEGSVLVGNQANGRTYSFKNPVIDGNVVLAMNYTIPAAGPKNIWNIMGTNEAGEEVIVASSISGIANLNWSDATLLSVTNSEGTVETAVGHNYQPRTRNCFILRNLTINMAAKTLSYDFLTYPDGSSGSLTNKTVTVSGTISLPEDIVSITGLNVPRNGNSYDTQMDNIMFYHEPADENSAVSFTVNYKDAEGATIGSKVYDVSSYKIGDSFNYILPAYIQEGTTVYGMQTAPETLTGSKEISQAEDSVDIVYGKTYENAQFMEFDGNADIYDSNKASNGEMKSAIQGGVQTITVENDGVYSVVIATGKTTADKTERTGSWNVNGTNTTSLTFNQTPSEYKFDNITMHTGDIINVVGFDSKCAVDYIYIYKTGDISVAPTTPEFSINLGDAYVSNGTEDFADQVATGYIATISNTGAEGTTTKVNVTVDTATQSAPVTVTLANGASVYIGMVLNNVDGNTQAVTATVE